MDVFTFDEEGLQEVESLEQALALAAQDEEQAEAEANMSHILSVFAELDSPVDRLKILEALNQVHTLLLVAATAEMEQERNQLAEELVRLGIKHALALSLLEAIADADEDCC